MSVVVQNGGSLGGVSCIRKFPGKIEGCNRVGLNHLSDRYIEVASGFGCGEVASLRTAGRLLDRFGAFLDRVASSSCGSIGLPSLMFIHRSFPFLNRIRDACSRFRMRGSRRDE